VAQLNTSGGGVPKRPVEQVEVASGVSSAIVRPRDARHGRPWQALGVWSAEVIDDFARHGHPISYGSAGQNVTVTGVEWARVRPGVVLALGSVRRDVVAFAAPCKENARWFRDGDFVRCRTPRSLATTRTFESCGADISTATSTSGPKST
jgi:MOSC domain-containing protein YiiM